MSSPSDQDDPKPETEERTTFFTLPKFEGAALMPKTEGKLLTALKAQLSQLDIVQSGSGIRHQEGKYAVLPRTLRSAWMAKVKHSVLGDMRFLIGQTRSTWVVVYDQPHERLYEDPRFMGIELKRRDVTRTSKGKQMYVSRIEKNDLDKINAIAAQDARGKAQPYTLAPVEGAFSYEQTLGRLRQCEVSESTASQFDLGVFLDGVRFMTPTQGAAGNYYFIDGGDGAEVCELHVDHDPAPPQGAYGDRVVLQHRDESAYLYIDIRY